MAFFEQQFDPRLSYGARGGPVWNTTRVFTQNGRRSANQNWQYPLHRYQVAHCIKTNADFEAVRAFFYTVAGAFDAFRFKDWSDFALTKANSRLTFITGATWQINRIYAVGSREFIRPIKKPVASPALIVYRTRTSVETVASATVATSTGIVTISGHSSGDTYTCVGQFDVPVAFKDDNMDAEITSHNASDYLMSWPSIVLEEVPV
jgi:uncharacterized protein (TIGR02217 family)